MRGIGYQAYRNQRINEGLSKSSIEDSGNERYCVYWGRSHQEDHETSIMARGHLKFGRAKFTTALQRGRNQAGADFRIYGEIILDSNRATYDFEHDVKHLLKKNNITGSQGQLELYNFKDDEIKNMITSVIATMKNENYYNIVEANIYLDDFTKIPLAV